MSRSQRPKFKQNLYRPWTDITRARQCIIHSNFSCHICSRPIYATCVWYICILDKNYLCICISDLIYLLYCIFFSVCDSGSFESWIRANQCNIDHPLHLNYFANMHKISNSTQKQKVYPVMIILLQYMHFWKKKCRLNSILKRSVFNMTGLHPPPFSSYCDSDLKFKYEI